MHRTRHPKPCAPFLVLLLLLAGVASAAAMRPVAMVVGTGEYQAGPVKFAVADAAKVADCLRDQNVFVREYANSDFNRLRGALEALGRDVAPQGIAVFYFNGYALNYQGKNYLLPRDASGGSIEAVVARCLPLDDVLKVLEASPARAAIVLLDCLAPSPFYEQLAGVEPGLAPVDPPEGILVGYAAQPGSYFLEQAPSLFAEHLVRQLAGRKLPVTEALRRMRQRVRQLTSGQQVPWIVHGLEEEVFLSPQDPDGKYFGAPIDPQRSPAEPGVGVTAVPAEALSTQQAGPQTDAEPPPPPFELKNTGALWEKAFRASPGLLDLPDGAQNYAHPSTQAQTVGARIAGARVPVEGYLRTREGVFWLTRESAEQYNAGKEPAWLLLSGMSGDESAIFAHLEKSPPLESGPPPFARYVPGSAGFVYSPFAGTAGVVDVRGFQPGDEVKCPYTGRLFRVP
jgi:hypothetical protein